MKATYLVPIPPETSLPSADLLQYDRPGAPGYKDGGFSCIGDVPQANVCIVLVDSSPETHAIMQADPKYVHIETLVEEVLPDAGE